MMTIMINSMASYQFVYSYCYTNT